MRPSLLLLVAGTFSLAVAGSTACSKDSSNGGSPSDGGAADSGSGTGGSSAGGGTSTGGTSAGGGSSTGGARPYDAAAVEACGVDGGNSECSSCLAANCCDAFDACLRDATCAEAFSTYQTCEKDPSVVDKSGCFSAFLRATRGDSGASRVHEPLMNCIVIGKCDLCGGPGIL